MVYQFTSLLLVGLLLKSGSSMMDHMIQESAIYASRSKDGDNIAWSKDPDWSNLDGILQDNGMTEMAELCTQGTWLLYEKPGFLVSENEGFRMSTGAHKCSSNPGKVMSMQPFGAENVMDSSITFFSEKNFGSKAFPLSTDTSRTTMDLFYGSVRSLITVGRDEWTVLMESADSTMTPICIRPSPVGPMYTKPICLLQNVELTALDPNVNVRYASKGCTEVTDEANIMIINDCLPFEEQGKLDVQGPGQGGDAPMSRSPHGGGVKNVLLCNGGTPNDELGVLLRFLKLRRENDFRNDPIIPWTNNNDYTWKSEIADMTFNIASMACPDLAVSGEFLQMTREAFMFELNEAWTTKAPESDSKEVEKLVTQLQKCLYSSRNGAVEKIRSMTIDKLIHAKPFTEHTSIHPNLMWNSTNNLVVDIAWMLANLVMSHCHTAFKYQNNFWYNYVRIFTELYLEPLAQTNWKNGQNTRQRHNFFLSGYGIDAQVAGIALCASNAVRINPNMEPFQRPIMS